MPLLAKRIFNCVKPLNDIKNDEKVYSITHTKEQFRSREEYEKRLQLYKSRIWTCQSTGHVNLTHEEAWNSEKTVLKTLKEQFAPCYDKQILELVHHCTKSLDCLVDQAWVMLQQVLVIGEKVLLKVKSGGKSMKAIVVKVDTNGVEVNPTSNSSSPSSDKENTEKDDNCSSAKKWTPPKLLPYKYSIRFENEDSVIHSVPASDLSRGDKPPSKELMRLFIRTYAVRAGQTPNSPWICDDAQVKKLDLQTKFASFLLSPVKWRPDEISKKIDEEVKKYKSPSKGSPRIKTKMDAKEERRKEKANNSITKLKEKSDRAKAAKEAASAKKSDILELDSSDDSSNESDVEEGSPKKDVVEVNSDSDSDTPLVKYQLTPKKKSNSETSKPKVKTKKSLSLADLKRQLEETKMKKAQRRKEKRLKEKKSKKGQDPKQMTLFDIAKKKGMKTPEKRSKGDKDKTPLKEQKTPDSKKMMSPPRTPAVVQKIRKAMEKNDKSLIGTYCVQAAKILNSNQRAKLPADIKEKVMNKYDLIQEKQKLARMDEAEKKDYLAKKAVQKKEELRIKMKQRIKTMNKRYEDTDLDLKPLPAPKLVVTPDNVPNDVFGDVTMVTEFISCYSGLLMPDDEFPIYSDALMKALASGKDGFTYLSRVLTVLLQTLLQDQIAEDYQELKVPLSDIPVNPCTTSELVRLCLRRRDVTDDKKDNSEDMEDLEEDEVSDELIQLLETQELYQLDMQQKLQILKGLCLRIMGTYSVQDYFEEKQSEATRMWKEKMAQLKEKNDKKKAKKSEEKEKKEDSATTNQEPKDKDSKKKDKDKPAEENSSLLLTHFYGKKGGEESTSGGNSGNNSETAMETDASDLASVVKRRRFTTAKAQEERRQKEIEDKIRREKEMDIFREQKEKENFEKQFTDSIYMAKVTTRQAPIGTDRNHARYWIFSDVTPGLFVEKGWVGPEMEYTCCKDTDNMVIDVSSSSEDEDEPEENPGANKRNKPPKMTRCVDTTFPHVGQNLWFTYDSMKEVDTLIESLTTQGSRESKLRKELQKRYSDISSAIFKFKRSNKELRDCDGDLEMIEALKREILETEMRLRNGGLGGVDDFGTWSKRLETAVGVSALADCLLETQHHVQERFRDGIMVVKKKKKPEVKEEVKEEEEDEDTDQVIEIAPGITRWREAVKSATTYSRLHVMLGLLDSCIKWEKSAENAKCKICRKKGSEDRLLLCDDCNQAFHMYCLRPALLDVPQGDWHCPACSPQYRKRVRDMPGRYNEGPQQNQQDYTDDEEDIKVAKTKSIKHDDKCVECAGDEDLVECAECPSVYHLECHDPPLRHHPRGRWVCNDCKHGIRNTKRARANRNRSAAERAKAKKVTPKPKKRSMYAESSSEEEESDEESDETQEEDSSDEDSKPPPKKVAKTSKGSSASKRGPKPKQESPKTNIGRPKGSRKSLPSPEMDYDIKPKVSRRAPSELSLIEDIVDQMLTYKQAWPFQLQVKRHEVPDYYDIIKNPISFQKIKDRLNCLVYGSPQEVIDSVALLFRNAVEYNAIGSEVYDCIEASEGHFVNLLKKALPFYSYNRSNVSNGVLDHHASPTDGRRSRRSK